MQPVRANFSGKCGIGVLKKLPAIAAFCLKALEDDLTTRVYAHLPYGRLSQFGGGVGHVSRLSYDESAG